jgi:tRNA pseudouridine32 synthase / 23S rRNA pseudouridine746 synthase
MKIIFENEFFVVIDKSAGVLSVPGRFGEKDPRPVAGLLLQSQVKTQIFPVHRLDFEVSGLLLFAKTKLSHSAANSWFENKKIKKIYLGFTEATGRTFKMNPGDRFEWKSSLLRGKKRAYESPHGKPSITIAVFEGEEQLKLQSISSGSVQALRWRLEPITGRSHQLRYELSKHGFPIIGDKLYGSLHSIGDFKIMLSAVELIFPKDEIFKWGLPEKLVL